MELDLGAAPPEAIPPKDWAQAEGRKGSEKLYPKLHLTMYTRVSKTGCFLRFDGLNIVWYISLGRALGEDE